MTEDRNAAGRRTAILPPWVGTAALALVALVALWFCVRATLFRSLEQEYPLFGQAISPPSPVSQALIALNRASARDGTADPLARDLLQSALRRAPLLADPFTVAGLDASAHDDFAQAARLIEESKRRDPRAVIPRYWLFDNYLRSGNYARGIAEAGPLIRIQPAAEPAAVAVLTALLQVPAARPALASALRARPVWSRAFFSQATASPSLRDPAAALLRSITPDDRASTGREQITVMRAMIGAGRYSHAYTLWLRTLTPDKRPQTPGLFDGGFTGHTEAPPFGWRFPGANDGGMQVIAASDSPSGSGLAIRSTGERARVLAEQLVLATPGPLHLRFATRALDEGVESSAGLKVELRCGPKGKALASQVVETFTSRLEAHNLATTMQEGCGAVLVRISVAPSSEPGPVYALLTDMALQRQ